MAVDDRAGDRRELEYGFPRSFREGRWAHAIDDLFLTAITKCARPIDRAGPKLIAAGTKWDPEGVKRVFPQVYLTTSSITLEI